MEWDLNRLNDYLFKWMFGREGSKGILFLAFTRTDNYVGLLKIESWRVKYVDNSTSSSR